MATKPNEAWLIPVDEETGQYVIEAIGKISDEERKKMFAMLGQMRQERADKNLPPFPIVDEMYQVLEKHQ